MIQQRNIIVIGSGIAGLIAALRLSRRFRVTLVTKSEIAESNTRWAQGGIAAAVFPDDSVAEHVADTLRAGAGLCNREAVEVLCSEGPARIEDLIRLGVRFDERDGALARGLEAAHSRARVLHAQGDATGLSIEMTLVRALRKADVEVLEHTFACDLSLHHGRVRGLRIITESGGHRELEADAVILPAAELDISTCTRPIRQVQQVMESRWLFALVPNWPTLNSTNFTRPHWRFQRTFLVSEAVRGEGAVLLDVHGQRFMQTLHPDAELAPRDVVARGIAMQMAAQGGQPGAARCHQPGEQISCRSDFPASMPHAVAAV